MPPRNSSWEAYFYPETYDAASMRGTLRNKLGERDADVLATKEYGRTTLRQRQLMSGEVEVPRTFDADHVRAIHGHLFQDVYDWAGEYRTVPIFKGTPVGFADVASGAVDRYLKDVKRLVETTPWAELDHDAFAERAATVFAYLNQAHPFREGNGRTSKVFMQHVAELSRFSLEYDRVTPREWNEASKWSGPDLHAYEPHPSELVPVFRAIAVDSPRALDRGGLTGDVGEKREVRSDRPRDPQGAVPPARAERADATRAKIRDRIERGAPGGTRGSLGGGPADELPGRKPRSL